MVRIAICAAAAAGIAAVTGAAGADRDAAACRALTPAPGYRMLFDGTQASLAGWAQAGPGRFDLLGDCTLGSVGGLGLLWNKQALASPVTIRVEWMIPADDNSGVFVGFPPPGNDPFVAVNKGYEVQIDASDVPKATTGAIYNFQAADQALRDGALNPPGSWNTFEITIDVPRVEVRLNGTVVNRFTSTDAARQTLAKGLVGLQNHSGADRVFVRSVQAKQWGAARPGCPRHAVRSRSDGFAGTRLDGCRWDRIVRYDGGGLAVSGGALRLEATHDAPLENLVLQRSPATNWTISTAVRPSSGTAGLLAYRSDGDWVQLVAGRGSVSLQSARCGGSGPSAAVRAGGSVFRLRLTRSGARYTGFWSRDGRRWTRVGSVTAPRLSTGAAFGLAASGEQRASPPPYASFDRFDASDGKPARPAKAACP